MIKALFFDFGQTLADSADGFRSAEKQAQKQIFAHLFPGAEKERWEDFLAAYRRLRKEFHGRSDFSRPSVWRAVFQAFNAHGDENLLLAWEDAYWQCVRDNTRLFPETQATLADLSSSYPLGLITNTQGQKSAGAHRIALYPQLESVFDAVIVAGEKGVPTKPDIRAFKAGLSALGVAPEESVYVGDDWRIDICGAKDAGLFPVWLKHRQVRRNWPRVTPTVPVIRHLGELRDVLPG